MKHTAPLRAGLLLGCFALSLSQGHAEPPVKKSGVQGLPEGFHELKIGAAAPDFALPGIDGKTHRLADYRDAKVLMIAFITNHCPDSHAADTRIQKLFTDLQGQSFALVAINPNHPEGLSIDELGYTKYTDGFDDMKKYAAEQRFSFPYLYDGDKQAVARAYGCLATPHIFVFDADRRLRYKGQFDDSRFADPATVKSPDAENAVRALLAGQPVPVEMTKPHGCSTKWREKKTAIAEATAKIDATPVDIELIDAAGAAALRKNGTRKVRLFNVWATWCGPCLAEFPELVKTMRQFSRRDFELITISLDDAASLSKAKAFLEKQGAGLPDKTKASLKTEGRKTNSYLYTGADTNALMKALDPDWPGGMPYTLLVDPDGKVLWRHANAVNGDELRAKILDVLGRHYRP